MSSRNEILRRIRGSARPDIDPPPAFRDGIIYADPAATFAEVLTAVGGCCQFCGTLGEADEIVKGLATRLEAGQVCSLVANVGVTTFDIAGISDPHEVAGVELAIMPGERAVAENAAVWTRAATPVERALLFLAQHLVLVVRRDALVSNLHEAYAQLDVSAGAFGCWISGPSKTADIEQSLVMGAHGPRTLTVLVVNEQ